MPLSNAFDAYLLLCILRPKTHDVDYVTLHYAHIKEMTPVKSIEFFPFAFTELLLMS